MHRPSRRALIRQVVGFVAAPTIGSQVCGQQTVPTSRLPRIKIGQIGVGHAHASKLSVYRRSDDYEVVGLVEPDDPLREGAKSKEPYQGLPWMTREQLLNVPGLQAVLVETPRARLARHRRSLRGCGPSCPT